MKLGQELQSKLGLSSWDITWDNELCEGHWGECDADTDDKTATISIKTGLDTRNRRRTIIHELLHIHSTSIRDVDYLEELVSQEVLDIVQNEIMTREEELVLKLEKVIYKLIYP